MSNTDALHEALAEVMGSRGLVSFNQRVVFIEGDESSADREVYERLYLRCWAFELRLYLLWKVKGPGHICNCPRLMSLLDIRQGEPKPIAKGIVIVYSNSG